MSNKYLNLFMWNDNKLLKEQWISVATKSERSIVKNVVFDSDIDSDETVEKYKQDFFDIVLVDIRDDRNQENTGFDIICKIREFDKLVPIIVVTRFPEKIYSSLRLKNFELAGIFSEHIMSSNLFHGLVVKPTLTQWHIIHPEFSLVRRCIWKLTSIEKKYNKGETCKDFKTLKQNLAQLPFTLSTDSWHKIVSGFIENILKKNNRLKNLEAPYKEICEIFQLSDPYFLAAQLGRRHLAHNVQVFLIGLIFLLDSDLTLYNIAVKNLKEDIYSLGEDDTSNNFDYLIDVILIWACASTTHDVGYLCENLKLVSDHLIKVSKYYCKIIEKGSSKITAWKWPEIKHGELGQSLWDSKKLNKELGDADKKIIDLIGKAIFRHNPSGDIISVLRQDWVSFLLVLCDVLQDWQREQTQLYPENKNWKFFVCDSIETDKALENEVCFNFHFLARDFAPILSDKTGTNSLQKINDTFESLREEINNAKLKSDKKIKINLQTNILTREEFNSTETVAIVIN